MSFFLFLFFYLLFIEFFLFNFFYLFSYSICFCRFPHLKENKPNSRQQPKGTKQSSHTFAPLPFHGCYLHQYHWLFSRRKSLTYCTLQFWTFNRAPSLSACLSDCLPVRLTCLYECMSVSLSVCMPLCLCVCLPVYLSSVPLTNKKTANRHQLRKNKVAQSEQADSTAAEHRPHTSVAPLYSYIQLMKSNILVQHSSWNHTPTPTLNGSYTYHLSRVLLIVTAAKALVQRISSTHTLPSLEFTAAAI